MSNSRSGTHHDRSISLSRSKLSTNQRIYLDYAATTPVATEVAAAMSEFLTVDGAFGNPHSVTHQFGHDALEAIDLARQDVARLIAAETDEVVWTSGATEAINLAIKGIMLSPQNRRRHLVVSALEHKAVLDTAQWLATVGFDVTHLMPDTEGMITPDVVESQLRPDTALVSVMHVNNEVGSVTDIPGIARITRSVGAFLHVDAAQSVARIPLDVSCLGADLLSLSAHKLYGPKGVGALFVRRGVQSALSAQIHGGGQERGLRSGTLPTHQIVGLGVAARIAKARLACDAERTADVDRRLLHWMERIDGCVINGNRRERIPGILNVAILGVEAESLMLAVEDVAFSTGSACTSASIEPSHVLKGLGISDSAALCSVRFSIGRYTTEAEIDAVGGRICDAVATLRSISR